MTIQEYLVEVIKAIRTNFYSPDPTGGMLVAILASVVRRSVGHDHTEFGFQKFGDVLRQLEQQGQIKTGLNSKNAFSIWLVDNSGAPPAPVRGFTEFSYRPLRKAVWLAFVSTMPIGRRFLNRNTGEVKVEPEDHKNQDPEWIEIMPLGAETERGIALDFLKNNNIDNGQIQASIQLDRWYVELPKLLSARSPALAVAWKRFRSQHVVKAVKKWCELNGVDDQLVYEEFPAKHHSAPARGRSEGSELKSLLLAAIARMSTDELMKLNLPASHMVAVLRPDLLS